MKIKKYTDFTYSIKIDRLNESLINEELGFKDIVMGFAILAGVINGSIDSAEAQNRLSDKTIKDQISATLKDSNKLNSVIDSLEERGMEDAADVIKNNADEVSKELGKLSRTYNVATVRSYEKLAEKLKKGWAISEVITKQAKETIERDSTLEKETFTVDTIDINWSNDELFEAGDFSPKDDFKSSITSVFEQLNDAGISIIKIKIESSTDKQRVKTDGTSAKNLKDGGYDVSNKGLSEARNNSVKDVINSVLEENDSEIPAIEQVILHDQGKGEENSPNEQDPSARYVKITIIAVEIQMDEPSMETIKVKEEKDVLIYSFKVAKGTDVDINIPGKKVRHSKSNKKKWNVEDCKVMLGGNFR